MLAFAMINDNKICRRSPCKHIELYNVYTAIMRNKMFEQTGLNIKIFNKLRDSCKQKMQLSPIKRPILSACVYDKHGNILAQSTNSYKKSHPLQKQFSVDENHIFLHAEMKAMIDASRAINATNLHEYSVAIVRLCRDMKLGQSSPCDGCFSAIINKFKIKEVTYYDEEYGICTVNCATVDKSLKMSKLLKNKS